ncbi:MAG TPA: hypothetical protein VG500_01890 [Gemmatimonadales bacterium]|jgi:hypothetical protein|nr:hypothetical protein [Gemmatimonadales bacterium]
MRSYWLKILLGAFGIFAVGMIGVTLVRSGIAKVNSVVESDGPITIPLGLIPFVLGGERLGNLDEVTLHRESPTRVEGVELTVDLADSLLAEGLSGCRLVANIEGDSQDEGVNIRVGRGPDHHNAFRCLAGDSVPPDLAEFGVAIFRPGDVEVPLLLPLELVEELQNLDFGGSTAGEPDPDVNVDADSIRVQVERALDSAGIQRERGESTGVAARRFADSVRSEARKRMAEQADSQ